MLTGSPAANADGATATATATPATTIAATPAGRTRRYGRTPVLRLPNTSSLLAQGVAAAFITAARGTVAHRVSQRRTSIDWNLIQSLTKAVAGVNTHDH